MTTPATDGPTHLDPESTRFADRAGVPVVLADGRTWHLAMKGIRLQPLWRGTGVEVQTSFAFPPRSQRAHEMFLAACDGQGEALDLPLDPFFLFAVALLRDCHNITEAEACALLAGGPEDFSRLLKAMMQAVHGDNGEPEPEAA